MSTEFVLSPARPSIAEQKESLQRLKEQYGHELQEEGILDSAKLKLEPDLRAHINPDTYTELFLGAISMKRCERVQGLHLRFLTPYTTAAGSQSEHIYPVSFATFYPDADGGMGPDGMKPSAGFTMNQARIGAAMMRGLIRLSLDELPDLSVKLNAIVEERDKPRFRDWLPRYLPAPGWNAASPSRQ